MTALHAVGSEVFTVNRKNRSDTMTLRSTDEGGIGEVHPSVGVLDHEFEGTGKSLTVDRQYLESTRSHKIHEAQRAYTCRLQQVKRFGEDGGSRC